MKTTWILFTSLCCLAGTYVQAQANDSCLVFSQLPSQSGGLDDRPLTILENGLQGWATIPKAFVDSTGSKGLPIELMRQTIPPLINGSAAFTTDSILALFSSYGVWWAPMLVVTLLGALFAVIFAVTGLVFCCCRCCNNCGGSKRMNKVNHEGILKLILGIIMIILLFLLVAGAIIALVGNEQVNSNVSNFNSEISDSISDIQQYFNSSVQELLLVVGQVEVVTNCTEALLRANLSAVGQQAVQNVSDDFSAMLASAQNTSTTITAVVATLNSTIEAVQMLGSELAALSPSLTTLRDDLTGLDTACEAASPGSPTCADIRAVRDQLQLNVSTASSLQTLIQIRDMTSSLSSQLDAAIATTNSTFNNGISLVDGLDSNLLQSLQSVINTTREFRGQVSELLLGVVNPFLTALDVSLNGTAAGSGSIAAAQQTIQSSTAFVQNIQRIIYGFVIVMCCFVLIVAAVVLGALCCGLLGFRRDAEPSDRTRVSHCGAIMLLIGVGLMFFFAFLLLVLTCVVFFFSSLSQKICYSTGPESNYEIFTQLTDARVWGTNQTLLESLFPASDGSQPISFDSLTAGGVILGCRANEPLYTTFDIGSLLASSGLSLGLIDNLTQVIPTANALLDQLPTNLNFNAENILTAETSQLLSDLINGSALSLDTTAVSDQLNQSLTSVSADGLLTNLAQWRVDAPGLAADISSIEMFVNTTIRSQLDAAMATQDVILMRLEELASLEQSVRNAATMTDAQVRNILTSLNQANVRDLLAPHVTAARDVIVDYASQYSNYSLNSIMSEVGRCRPLFNSYNDLYVSVCEYTLVGLNAFWWSLGWCVLFFIPIIVLSVVLARFFARMEGPVGYDDATLGRTGVEMQAKSFFT